MAIKHATPSVRQVTIDPAHSGQRVDNFLITALKGVPKTHIYRLVRKGEVRINKGRTRPDYRLQVGDVVRIPPVRTARTPAIKPQAAAALGWLEQRVLYEDQVILVLDKPAGVPVHAGSGLGWGVIEGLRALRPNAPFLELVHRLDRATSGCLLIAKERPALLSLQASWRSEDPTVDKRYLALVQGQWRGGKREVTASLQKNRLRSGERMTHVEAAGREAVTEFMPKQIFARAGVRATLVEIRLHTGRTHQARVHAAHTGHAIAGDDKYGDRAFNKTLHAYGLQRMFLHAASLRFPHPTTRRVMDIVAPLPADLQRVLGKLDERSV